MTMNPKTNITGKLKIVCNDEEYNISSCDNLEIQMAPDFILKVELNGEEYILEGYGKND